MENRGLGKQGGGLSSQLWSGFERHFVFYYLPFHWCPLLVKSKQKMEVMEVKSVRRKQMWNPR